MKTYIAMVVLIAGLIIYAGVNKSRRYDDMLQACHAKGGFLLDHTEVVGKNRYHDYACINSDAIIDY